MFQKVVKYVLMVCILFLCKQKYATAQSIDSLIDASWELRNLDSKSSIKLARKALRFSLLELDTIHAASASNIIGINYKNKGVQDSALFYYRFGLQLRFAINETSLIIGSLNNIGNLYRKIANYDSALVYYEKARQLLLASINKKEQAKNSNNLGIVFRQKGEYGKALRYLYEALEIQKEMGQSIGLGEAELSLGNFFNALGDLKKARFHYQNSLVVFNIIENGFYTAKVLHNLGNVLQQEAEYAKARKKYLEALAIYEKQNYEHGVAETSNSIGSLFVNVEKWDSAQKYLNISIKANRVTNNLAGESEVLNNLGLLFLRKNQPSIAIQFLEKGYALADSVDNFKAIETTLENLSKSYALTEEYDEAYRTQELLINAKKEKWSAVSEAKDIALEYQEQKRKIEQQEAELKERELESETQNLINIGLIIFSFLVSVLLIMVWFSNRQNKKRYKAEKQMTELEKAREVHTLRAVLLGQEAERKRIADDLHSSLGVKLAAAKMGLDAVQTQLVCNDMVYSPKNKEAIALVDESCKEIRRISHIMHPISLERYGLERAVADLIRPINQSSGVRFSLQTYRLPNELPKRVEIHLYRIIEDLIANVLKHAHATNANIQIIYSQQNKLSFMMDDNGCGFIVEKKDKSGLGLSTIHTRVKDLGGRIVIDSGKGSGTTITIDQIELNDEKN